MSTGNQRFSLFSKQERASFFPPMIQGKEITITSPLHSAVEAYRRYLSLTYSPHTVKSFTSDIRLLVQCIGDQTPLEDISTRNLQEFLYWLNQRKGHPQSPNTLSRRVTALKNFFRWLKQQHILSHNPAEKLIHKRPIPPLPEILTEHECQRLLTVAKTDPREHSIILLLLQTGLKKAELLHVEQRDVDLSHPDQPELLIRHRNPNKQRRLKLHSEFSPVYQVYIEKYGVTGVLFPFTERNLTYILSGVTQKAEVKRKVSAQILRDTCAVRQLRVGEQITVVLRRLGIAPGRRSEKTRRKYQKLAEPAL